MRCAHGALGARAGPSRPLRTRIRRSREQCRSRGRKHEEEACDPQERITAVQHPQISLLYGNQAEKYGYAAEARPQTDRKKQSEAQKNPEKCRDPAIVLRHQGEQVEPHTRLYLRRRLRRNPAVDTKPVQPVAVQQDHRRRDAKAINNAEERDGKRRLWSEKETAPTPALVFADSLEISRIDIALIENVRLGIEPADSSASRLDIGPELNQHYLVRPIAGLFKSRAI